MPELAEVEYYRKQWDAGLGKKVVRVRFDPTKRVFRGLPPGAVKPLAGATLQSSQAAGKQMVFVFSGRLWLGLHLGMTGKLSVEKATFEPGKHDHLVLYQSDRALVFSDMRQFGRVQIHEGSEAPKWWSAISPAVTSAAFTLARVNEFLEQHKRLPMKGVLLHQKGFPGIGNWMADEILWRAAVAPKRLAGELNGKQTKAVWRETRFVARQAVESIGKDFRDPPAGWLFHQRWGSSGVCPRHGKPLRRETIAGRTTAWCSECQE